MKPLEQAKWIWSNFEPETPNQWSMFRRRLLLSTAPRKAVIHICADTRYRLFVNGAFVGFGPARYHVVEPAFDSHEVTEFLVAGNNLFAVLVHSIGVVPSCSSFMPCRGALIGAIVIDGNIAAATDSSWKARTADAYCRETPRLAGSHQGFQECYDARLSLPGWETAVFDDACWPQAAELSRGPVLEPWRRLVPRDIPFLSFEREPPATVLETGVAAPPAELNPLDMSTQARTLAESQHKPDAAPALELLEAPLPGAARYIIFDFGYVSAGYPRVFAEGAAGTIIDLGYSEELSKDRVNVCKQGLNYADRLILGEAALDHTVMMPRCFRYMHVEVRGGPLKRIEVSRHTSHYPVEARGGFECSDELLNRVWQLGAHTVKICMEDCYMDTPWRERAGWVFDAVPEAMVNYYAFGDCALIRRFLRLVMKGQDAEGRILSKYPARPGTHMPSGAACYALVTADYLNYSGDIALLEELWPGLLRLAAWFASNQGKNGLLDAFPQHGDDYVFIDWAPIECKGAITAMNCLYHAFLRAMAGFAARLRLAALEKEFANQAAALAQAVRVYCWNAARGLFANCLDKGRLSRRCGQHENLLALHFGIASAEQQLAIERNLGLSEPLPVWSPDSFFWLDAVENRLPWDDSQIVPVGTPYFSYYLLAALFGRGYAAEALAYIRSHWGKMTAAGATSCWERWSPDSGSNSHGWSAGPTALLSRHILGVVPLADGFGKAGVYPAIAGLEEAKGKVPTPRGEIEVAWRAAGQRFDLEITGPAGVVIEAGVPAEAEKCAVRINGRPAEAGPFLEFDGLRRRIFR